MVMSFFRRAEDGSRSLPAGYRPASITDQCPAAEEPLRYAIPDVNDFAAQPRTLGHA